jgi:cytochrome b561
VWKNSDERYGVPSKFLHWAIALLIIGLIVLGWWMVGLNFYHRWYHAALEWHKSVGMMVLGLVAIKVLWRWWSPYPALAATLGGWQRRAAHAVHGLLWVAMVAIPVTGYAISTAEGRGVDMFGWIEIPAVLPKSEWLRDQAEALHKWFSYGALALVLVHAAAALKHQFLDRDGTLRRMLW